MRFFIISFILLVVLQLNAAQVRFINPQRNFSLYPEYLDQTNFRKLQIKADQNSNSTASETSAVNHPITVRLYGDSSLGYYYINLFFGSTLQKESLIVDTGSSITAIPCNSKVKYSVSEQ